MRLKKFFLGVAIHLCALATVFAIWLFCFNVTIMDRTEVKSWVSKSAIYDKLTPVISANANTSGVAGQLLSQAQINQVVASIYPPQQIKIKTESTVDVFYDWAEGKTAVLQFTNPLAIVPADLQGQLAGALREGSANLAVCTAQLVSNNQLCRPANVSSEEFSQRLASQAVAGAAQSPNPQTVIVNNTSVGSLPSVKQVFNWLLILMPLIASICLVLILWLGRNNKLIVYKRAARQLFFAVIMPAIFVIIAIYLAKRVTTLSGLVPAANLVLVDLFLPIIRNAIDTIGTKFLTIAIPMLIILAVTWLVLHFLHKSQKNVHTPAPEAPYLNAQNDQKTDRGNIFCQIFILIFIISAP